MYSRFKTNLPSLCGGYRTYRCYSTCYMSNRVGIKVTALCGSQCDQGAIRSPGPNAADCEGGKRPNGGSTTLTWSQLPQTPSSQQQSTSCLLGLGIRVKVIAPRYCNCSISKARFALYAKHSKLLLVPASRSRIDIQDCSLFHDK
jgi:hypothetical protein